MQSSHMGITSWMHKLIIAKEKMPLLTGETVAWHGQLTHSHPHFCVFGIHFPICKQTLFHSGGLCLNVKGTTWDDGAIIDVYMHALYSWK